MQMHLSVRLTWTQKEHQEIIAACADALHSRPRLNKSLRRFGLSAMPDLTPRYNVAPSQAIAAVGLKPDAVHRGMAKLRWGLVPFWSKDRTPAPAHQSAGGNGRVQVRVAPAGEAVPDPGRWLLRVVGNRNEEAALSVCAEVGRAICVRQHVGRVG